MNIRIEKGSLRFFKDCEIALSNSELGRRYFSAEASAADAVKEGLGSGNLYIALCDEQYIGFIWYLPEGAFHCHPYLHIVAVKEEYRGKGVGKELIGFFEELAFGKSDKIFLVVADFNLKSKGLYEKIGYRQVGELPGLYRRGITEYLMMKEKE